MDCGLNNCQESILMGMLCPLVLCLLFYLCIGIYVVYLTNKYHSIDIKQWRSEQLLKISHKYDQLIKKLN